LAVSTTTNDAARSPPRSSPHRVPLWVGDLDHAGAIDFAMERFVACRNRTAIGRIIDISGDGPNNSGRPVTEARDQAVAEGVTITVWRSSTTGPTPATLSIPAAGGLPEWYRQNGVIGGPGSFLRAIDDFRSFRPTR